MGAATPTLLTIGYEGRTLDEYLAMLRDAGCSLLCDVRRNPVSRKPGFSKQALAGASAGQGIRYEHIPALGIASVDRKGLGTAADVAALFARYRRDAMPRLGSEIDRIAAWVASGERVALTCFERAPDQCHRHIVAEAVVARTGATLQDL